MLTDFLRHTYFECSLDGRKGEEQTDTGCLKSVNLMDGGARLMASPESSCRY